MHSAHRRGQGACLVALALEPLGPVAQLGQVRPAGARVQASDQDACDRGDLVGHGQPAVMPAALPGRGDLGWVLVRRQVPQLEPEPADHHIVRAGHDGPVQHEAPLVVQEPPPPVLGLNLGDHHHDPAARIFLFAGPQVFDHGGTERMVLGMQGDQRYVGIPLLPLLAEAGGGPLVFGFVVADRHRDDLIGQRQRRGDGFPC